MIDVSKRLLYYKRKDIQKAIVDSCKQREVGIRYGDKGFGKRPDVLVYENDVIESVKNGATSFHVSEERWHNPMQLNTDFKKPDLDALRTAWDLVIDIDCENWFFSKLSADLFITALKEHGLKSISCKFSGNKGFHIGIPFESFPKEINNVPLKNWFPNGPKRIALYLLDYIATNLITVKDNEINFNDIYKTTIKEISKLTKKSNISIIICAKCNKKVTLNIKKTEFICKKCSNRITRDTNFLICPKCNTIMEKVFHNSVICNCGSIAYKEIFDPLTIIDLDTLLISSRHMYRAQYSMHEKSGLVSLPINPDHVLKFDKRSAETQKIKVVRMFLDPSSVKTDEGRNLIIQGFDYQKKNTEPRQEKTYELPDQAIPEEFFPPSIKKGLQGLEDGKKRFLFILTNFLATLGWTYPKIVERVNDWNKLNPTPLKENYIQSHLKYVKLKKPVPPPNYNTGYYQDLGITDPENIMLKYKNPVTYAKALFDQNKKTRKRLTSAQKEMRKKYRASLKNENSKEKH